MSVKIVGGKSGPHRVSIISDKFVSTADSDKNGNITCEVKRHSYLLRFLYKNKYPLPRTVRMVLLLIGGMTRKSWILFGLYIFGAMLLTERLSAATGSMSNASVSSFFEQYWWASYLIILPAVLLYTRCRTARWHGAEHMAIASYDRTGLTDVQHIAKECPVHDKCGGRLLFPIVIGAITARMVAQNFEINHVIVYFIALECVLWVDALKGWDKIPGTSHVSRLIQKATTRVPGKQELLTAQRALQELVTASTR